MAVNNLVRYKTIINKSVKHIQDFMVKELYRGGEYDIGSCYTKYYGIWQSFPFRIRKDFKVVAWEENNGRVYIGLPYKYIHLVGKQRDVSEIMSLALRMVDVSKEYPASYKKFADMILTNGFELTWLSDSALHADDFKKTEFYIEYMKNLKSVDTFELVFDCQIWPENKIKRRDVFPIAFFDFDVNLYYRFKNPYVSNSNLTSFSSVSIFNADKVIDKGTFIYSVYNIPWSTLIFKPKYKDECIVPSS